MLRPFLQQVMLEKQGSRTDQIETKFQMFVLTRHATMLLLCCYAHHGKFKCRRKMSFSPVMA